MTDFPDRGNAAVLAAAQPRIPVSTYRLQFNAQFTFKDAEALLPYLSRLGITDVYASPLFMAAPGSMHGYDICDHTRLNPELGTEEDFNRLSGALQKNSMGLVLDFVPNHMGAHPSANSWWRDVLTNGPSSLYADFFDIEWDPIKPELQNKILLPILGDQYGRVLERGELKLKFDDGGFSLAYYEHDLPINPRQCVKVLGHRLDELKSDMPPDDADLREFLSIQTALSNLPPSTERDREKKEERNREAEICRERLRKLVGDSERIRRHIDENVQIFNGEPGRPESFDRLHDLLEAQPYRLAYWRTALDEINYRRFFDINSLAGLREENDEVFDRVHQKLFQLIREGKVTGLRLDHVDGLYDPAGYLAKLQQKIAAPSPFYVVVEKILSLGETLPPNWAVHGTTGYDFLNDLNGLFIDSQNALALKKIYERFTGWDEPFAQTVYQCKFLIMMNSMTSELSVLAHILNRISEQDRRTRDFTLETLRRALREVVAAFPLYRAYVSSAGWNETDEKIVSTALGKTSQRHPTMEPSILQFVRENLLPAPQEISDELYRRRLDFAMKFQQYTSPIQAKGLEDTAFYRYSLLLSLNEVGGDPQRFGRSLKEFHETNAARRANHPSGMLSTATHDTKRGEDARARINVLSEIPDQWRRKTSEWSRINASHKAQIAGGTLPDRNEEYFFYQTLLGAWPDEQTTPAASTDFVERVKNYMMKTMREAKTHTSWINNNRPSEEAVLQFIEKSLTGPKSQKFLESFLPFQRRVAFLGMLNSISQVVLKNTSPGVPDLYQGGELWDLNMADPDNRRPVDFKSRAKLLDEMEPFLDEKASEADRATYIRELLDSWLDGRVKFFALVSLLRARKSHADLFGAGDYQPIVVDGEMNDHLAAFCRGKDGEGMLVVVPRRLNSIIGTGDVFPLGEQVWRDERLPLPTDMAGFSFRDIFTGRSIAAGTGDAPTLRLADLFRDFPAAVLIGKK